MDAAINQCLDGWNLDGSPVIASMTCGHAIYSGFFLPSVPPDTVLKHCRIDISRVVALQASMRQPSSLMLSGA